MGARGIADDEMDSTADPTRGQGRSGTYDVVIVGGGLAGLAAALVLGRARRSVLVVNAGHPRNEPANHAHGYLTRDGAAPLELLAIGRDEVRRYGGEVAARTATSLERRPASGFRRALAGGAGMQGGRLLLSTGLVSVPPHIPGPTGSSER